MIITEADWADLEAGDLNHGVVTKRLMPKSGHDVYVAVQRPANRRMLLVRVPATVAEKFVRQHRELPQTRGIQLAFAPALAGHRDLQMALTGADRAEVFNSLIADVAAAACRTEDAVGALEAAVDRFEHWRRLLQSIADNGLSPEARRGLFGELTVLRDYILPVFPAAEAIRCWTGPAGANQDFQLPSAAIEVKTGSGMRPASVVIASERQLDATGTGRLILVHLAVDERRGGSGASLNAVVDALRAPLLPAVRAVFDDMLIRVGFLQKDRTLYEELRYTVRAVTAWHVTGDFPRITETDLRPGVSQCRYRISTVGLDRYVIAPDDLSATLKEQP
jgi:hypothetical protein